MKFYDVNTFETIELEPTSAKPDRIRLPVKALNDIMGYMVADIITEQSEALGAAEEWYKREMIVDTRGYLQFTSSHIYNKVLFIVDVHTTTGTISKKAAMDADPKAVCSILSQFFKGGASGLKPQFKEYFEARHTQFSQNITA